jgi:hypothetical protein
MREALSFGGCGAGLAYLFWTVVFGVAYTQASLYYSNQNQYFLHGLAAAGRGDLDRDWLANTKDPTPLFSGLVALTGRYLPEWFFYAYYLLILGVYFHCLVALFRALAPETPSLLARLCFIAIVVAVHAGIVRWLSVQLSGVDYPWFLQAGLAGQYLLGFGLQPSVFGVFLLVSVVEFLRDRPYAAVACASAAALMHATYLLSAALLTLAYMFVLYRRRNLVSALFPGGLALILVAPTVLYSLIIFAPTSPKLFSSAQSILAQFRIPHHAVIARWFDATSVAQIIWIALSIFVVRGHRLFPVLLIVFVGSLFLTLVQLATQNDTLALFFPWRASAFLMPIATTVILSTIVVACAPRLERLRTSSRASVLAACGLVIALCFLGGLAVPVFKLGYAGNDAELPLLEFVKNHHQSSDVYLIPVEPPKQKLTTPRVPSTNFTPPPTRSRDDGLIAVDLQSFRLATGAPIYVDFKCIPYKDEEVLEWHRRLEWCQEIYASEGPHAENVRAELAKQGLTHVVVPTDRSARFAVLGAPTYRDAAYCVFRVADPR